MSEVKKINELIGQTDLKRMLEAHSSGQPVTVPKGRNALHPETKGENLTIIPSGQLPSREILQSYLVTSALYDFDVYEKRILYNIIKFAQKELSGIHFKDNIRQLDHSLKGYVKVTLPISDFLVPTGNKNHSRIKSALRHLQTDTFTYMDSNTWESLTLIAYPKITYHRGLALVTFLVSERVWDVILNFSKGYSKFYFDIAFSLESVYSMRLYEMLSSQKHAISYSIASLRKFFELDKPKTPKDTKPHFTGPVRKTGARYPNTSDMIRKVIEPARQELDRKSPVTFSYETIRSGRKITGILFTPIRQDNMLPSGVQFRRDAQRYGCSVILNTQELEILHAVGFNKKGIDNNLDAFVDAKRYLDDFLLDITELKGQSRGKENPCGWFVNALRGRVADAKEKNGKFYRM